MIVYCIFVKVSDQWDYICYGVVNYRRGTVGRSCITCDMPNSIQHCIGGSCEQLLEQKQSYEVNRSTGLSYTLPLIGRALCEWPLQPSDWPEIVTQLINAKIKGIISKCLHCGEQWCATKSYISREYWPTKLEPLGQFFVYVCSRFEINFSCGGKTCSSQLCTAIIIIITWHGLGYVNPPSALGIFLLEYIFHNTSEKIPLCVIYLKIKLENQTITNNTLFATSYFCQIQILLYLLNTHTLALI